MSLCDRFSTHVPASRRLGPCLALVLGLSSMAFQAQPAAGPAARPAAVPRGPAPASAVRPLVFEANRGQIDSSVALLSRGPGYQVLFTSAAVVFVSANESVRLTFAGATAGVSPSGVNELQARANYMVGNDPAKWHTRVPLYERVRYASVYPGIDAVYYGTPNELEFDFVVAPGADPRRIRLAVAGASQPRLDKNGDALIGSTDRGVRLRRPIAYQTIDGRRRHVASAFVIRGRELRFALGAYDRREPLVIDPMVIAYATFLGGSSDDGAEAIAVDASGCIYVTGSTTSIDFPALGPIPGISSGPALAFVTKLDPSKSGAASLIYSTYLGGGPSTKGRGIAVNAASEAYVAGETTSQAFPVTAPPENAAFQSGLAGGADAFVSKLNAAGDRLLYSTYFGAQADDGATAVAVDASGAAYVTGLTFSDPLVPATALLTTANVVQPAGAGQSDAFVAKFDPAQSGPASLAYATYLGGTQPERAHAIAVDTAGRAFVTGYTASVDFPSENAAQLPCNGCPATLITDAFVTALNATATRFVYSTHLGGHFSDIGVGIAVDAAGKAYVTGDTAAPSPPTSDVLLPITTNAFQSTAAGETAFLTKLNAAGAIEYSSFFGNRGVFGGGIAVDASQNAHIAGRAVSSTGTVPMRDPLPGQGTRHGSLNDAFVATFDTAQSGNASLVFSTYLGGGAGDSNPAGIFGRTAIAVDGAGNLYVAAGTESVDFPVTPATAYQPALRGTEDGFVAKIVRCGPAPGSWTATGSLAPPGRTQHTATRLANGKVLVAGGLDVGNSLDHPLSSALVYDPIAGAFTPTGPMSTPRFRHTATLLPNGTVLVAGGVTTGVAGVCTNTAELYDPAANGGVGAFMPLSPMVQYRADYAATLLPNGNVLLVGGSCSGGQTAEIFDPAANGGGGAFTPTGVMSSRRVGPSATLLPDGKVLVAGGADTIAQTLPAAAELFDPAAAAGTGAFMATGVLAAPRYAHQATLLPSGAVLITGGIGPTLAPIAQAEIYTPAGMFVPTASLATARSRHTATRLATGQVLVAGGQGLIVNGNEPPLASAEIFDESAAAGTGAFVAAASMGTGRDLFTATLLADGTVLAAGGLGTVSTVTATAERFALDVCVPANTPPGAPVTVRPVDPTSGQQPVSVTFGSVSRAGVTSVTTSTSGPAPPANVLLGTGTYYHIDTTASYSGTVTVCIDYGGTPLAGTTTQPSFGHYDAALGIWTTMTVTSWDQANNVICGTTNALSPFALFVPVAASDGRMNGEGTIEDARGRRHAFAFQIGRSQGGDERGWLHYRVKARKSAGRHLAEGRFETTSILAVAFVNNSAVFSGEGEWNGRRGHTFEARATDAGDRRRGRDVFAMTIRDSRGKVVAEVRGTLATGNIEMHRGDAQLRR